MTITRERKTLLSFNENRLTCLFLNIVCVAIFLAGGMKTSHGAEHAPVFSHGEGSYELIIFSDYFCPPCQKIHKEFSETIPGLIDSGGVKVTFVDLPIYQLTPLYAKYFLYALHASPGYKEALRARNFLFDKAYRIGAVTAEHLERDLKAEGIPFTPYDVRPSLDQYDAMIKKYRAYATPTFVFIYSPKDIRTYSGSEPIRKGMEELMRMLERRD